MKLKELVLESHKLFEKSLVYKELYEYLSTFVYTDTKPASSFIPVTIITGAENDKIVPEFLIREVQDEVEYQMEMLEKQSQDILEMETT